MEDDLYSKRVLVWNESTHFGVPLAIIVETFNYGVEEGSSSILNLSISDQVRLPAEFKHIIQRWKRNQMRFP